MEIMEEIQGSEEWLALRAKNFCASDAPVIMGFSKYRNYADWLKEKITGLHAAIDIATQARFDAGHAAEEAAREHAENLVGESLYQQVGTAAIDGMDFLASFDGISLDGKTVWENKLWNGGLAAQVEAGIVPDTHWPQLEHQLMVSEADRVFFTVSDGTAGKFVLAQYFSIPERRAKLIACWKQAKIDIANYQAPEPEKIAPAGRAPQQLMALHVECTGLVTATNLAEWRANASDVLSRINTDLRTDEDFADADKTVKWCKDAEEQLDAAKKHALSQTRSIDELFRVVDEIKEEARLKRLVLEKLVKSRKDEIRAERVLAAQAAFRCHAKKLEDGITEIRFAFAMPDFCAAIKGLKTIGSIDAAIYTAFRHATIEADMEADDLRLKLGLYSDTVGELGHLFRDLDSIIRKPADDFLRLVESRISLHKAKESERLAKIEADAKARAEREADARVAAEEARIRREEREKMDAEERAKGEAVAAALNEARQKRMAQVDAVYAEREILHKAALAAIEAKAAQGAAIVEEGRKLAEEARLRKVATSLGTDLSVSVIGTINAFLDNREWGKGERNKALAILIEFFKFVNKE